MTTKEQFIEWLNEYVKDRNRDLHKLYNNYLASILEDFKYEVDGTMFDYYIEDISDTRYWDCTYTHITWYSEALWKTVVVADIEYPYEFEEPWEIYDLFEEWDKMCMEVKDKIENKYILVEHPQGTDDDTPWISVYRKLEDAKKRLEELYEQDKENFDTEEWKDEESYCLSRGNCEQISEYIKKQKAF